MNEKFNGVIKKMKSIIIWLAKKYILSAINDLLERYKNDVVKITTTLEIWIKKLQIIIEELKVIMCRVADGKIDCQEIELSIKEIENIIKEW